MTIVMWALLGVLLLAVVLLAWLLVRVLQQQGRLLLRIEALERPTSALETPEDPARGGLPLATAFPPFRLAELGGKEVGLEDFETRVLLVHWSPECGFCREIAADLARLQEDPATEHRARSRQLRQREQPRACGEHGLRCPVLLQPDGRTIAGFARMGTPAAYLLDDRRRREARRRRRAECSELAEEAAGSRRHLASERPLSESLIEREGLKAGFRADLRAAGSRRSARLPRPTSAGQRVLRLQRP